MSKDILAAILSCEGTSLTDREKYLFSEYNPLGISLFSRNIKTISQTRNLIKEIKETIGRDDVLIGIDQEGGRVSRLENIENQKFASQETLGNVDKLYTKYHAELISAHLNKIGINLNFAPVIDKKNILQNSVLEKRCFSENARTIVKLAKIMVDTYMKNGICPCLKHIPGHFNTNIDPHLGLPIIDMSVSGLKKYISYIKQLKEYPLAMTSHVLIPSIDKENPVTKSEKIIKEIIREYLEFDGFLLSDAIEMHALNGTITEKMNQSLNSDIDAILYCGGIFEDLKEICQQRRILTEKSLIRFAKIKNILHNESKSKNLEKIRNSYNGHLESMLSEKYSYDATETLHKMQMKGEN